MKYLVLYEGDDTIAYTLKVKVIVHVWKERLYERPMWWSFCWLLFCFRRKIYTTVDLKRSVPVAVLYLYWQNLYTVKDFWHPHSLTQNPLTNCCVPFELMVLSKSEKGSLTNTNKDFIPEDGFFLSVQNK